MNRDELATPSWLRTWTALALLCVLWGLIYVPFLGTRELKGEEGRRVLPAMAIVESGDWIALKVGGVPYLRKPPLANWCIAVAIKATGAIHEWTVRWPSALSVLALVLGVFYLGRRLLQPQGAFLAAVFVLTNIGLIEKGRLAEIDAIYIACFGLAFLFWLHWEEKAGQLWKGWLISGFFLGLGMMTKGPLPLLLFFYVFVVWMLWTTRRLRQLLTWGHALGVLATLLPFVLWAFAQVSRAGAAAVTSTWTSELAERAAPHAFGLGGYLEGIVRGVVNFLPWALLLPLLWWKPAVASLPEAQRARFIAMRRALVACYFVIVLLPGSRPRYAMPMLVPASLLLAQLLAHYPAGSLLRGWRWTLQALAVLCGLVAVAGPVIIKNAAPNVALCAVVVAGAAVLFGAAHRSRGAVPLGAASAGLAVLGVALLGALLLPVQLATGDVARKTAQQLRAFLPPGERLYAVRPESERSLIHLGFQVACVGSLQDVPQRTPVYVLVKEAADKEAMVRRPGATRLHALVTFQNSALELWRLDAPAKGASTNASVVP